MAREGQPGLDELLGQADWLRRLARHLAGADGDDVAQEVLLVAHRSPPDPARPLRPWLGQVARNLASVARRTDRRRREREAAHGANAAAEAGRSPAVDDAYERLELDRFVATRVMALDEPLRTVVVLRYYEGLDSAGIAAVTGAPAGTVRWRLKQALERLRGDLDGRHEGDRRAWCLLILSPNPPGTSSAMNPGPGTGALVMSTAGGKKVAGLGLVLLVLVSVGGWQTWQGWQRWGRPRGGSPQAGVDTAVARADLVMGTEATPSGVPPRLLGADAGVESTLAGCQELLSRAAREATARDREATALVPQVAFELGQPNHELHRRVEPQVRRIMKGAAPVEGVAEDVACRDWACRITLVVPAVDSDEVEPRLEAMQKWVPRARRFSDIQMGSGEERPSFSFGQRRTSADPVSGQKLEEFVFFVGLPPADRGEDEAPASEEEPPSSLPACTHQLAAVRARIARREAALAGQSPPAIRYAAAPRAGALTERVREAAIQALGGAGERVECRGHVCSLPLAVLPVSPTAALEKLSGQPALAERLLMQEIAPSELFFTVAAESIPSLLSRLRAPMRAPGFFAGCPAPPREGNVLVRLVIPATGETNEDGVYQRMSVKLVAGTLAAEASAACLMERFAAMAAAQELPAPIGNLLRFESWVWRPGEAPTMVTPPGL